MPVDVFGGHVFKSRGPLLSKMVYEILKSLKIPQDSILDFHWDSKIPKDLVDDFKIPKDSIEDFKIPRDSVEDFKIPKPKIQGF